MTTTIVDIAREAGVSRATVSLVLRQSPLVAARTRELVQSTIERLGYQPNRLAASLRSKRSYILGLVVSDLTYPHYARMSVGVEETVEREGYSLIIANSHESVERERRHFENLRRYRADGVFVTPVHLTPAEVEHIRVLAAERYPIVTLYREIPATNTDFCGTDVYGATRQLVGYLADLGHRHIAAICGDLPHSTNPVRLRAWRDEMAARGLDATDTLVVIGKGTRQAGEQSTRDLLSRGQPVTAIVCFNDFLALGALRALHLEGVRVPEEVSVAGMGGFTDLSPPERLLTTMADDYRQIGREAGALLLERIQESGSPSRERRLVPAQLQIGETTAPCR
jgi:LacI family transcriptional regulator